MNQQSTYQSNTSSTTYNTSTIQPLTTYSNTPLQSPHRYANINSRATTTSVKPTNLFPIINQSPQQYFNTIDKPAATQLSSAIPSIRQSTTMDPTQPTTNYNNTTMRPTSSSANSNNTTHCSNTNKDVLPAQFNLYKNISSNLIKSAINK